ncbi:MAG: hypothetical protein GF320_06790 [Armatimonadia bacterium]|nr:hypothetical protein [Armatimonadia bacterium]
MLTALAFLVASGIAPAELADQWHPPCPEMSDGLWLNPSFAPYGLPAFPRPPVAVGSSVGMRFSAVLEGDNPLVGDVDGDGEREVVLSTGRELKAYSAAGKVRWSRTLPHQVGTVILGDVDNDPALEIIAATHAVKRDPLTPEGRSEGARAIHVINVDGDGDRVIRQAVDRPAVPGEELNVFRPTGCADIDDDGNAELIIAVATTPPPGGPGHRALERHIAAIDTVTWERDWTRIHPLHPYVVPVDLTDAPGLELLIAGNAHGNRYFAEVPDAKGRMVTRDDLHVYLLLLDSRGREIWCIEPDRPEGAPRPDERYGWYCRALPCDILGQDGRMELVCLSSSTSGITGEAGARLSILDPATGRTLRDRILDVPMSDPIVVGDVDGDGVLEIVGGSMGRVLVFDEHLTLEDDIPLGRRYTDLRAIADLDGDGAHEIMAQGGDEAFVVDLYPSRRVNPIDLGDAMPSAWVPADPDSDGYLETLCAYTPVTGTARLTRLMELEALDLMGERADDPVPLVTGLTGDPVAWSPGGRYLVLRRREGLAVADLDGGTETPLPDTGPGSTASWSSSGETLAVMGRRGDMSEVRMARAPDFSQTTVLSAPGLVDAAPSPDEREVAVCISGDLFIKSLPDGPIHRVTEGEGIDSDPLWSPDGTMIAFVRETGAGDLRLPPRRDLWIHHRDSGDAVCITGDGAMLDAWAAVGRMWGPPLNVVGRPMSPLVSGASWTPDGCTIAFSCSVFFLSDAPLSRRWHPWGGSARGGAYADPLAPVSLCVSRSGLYLSDPSGRHLWKSEVDQQQGLFQPSWSPRGLTMVTLRRTVGDHEKAPPAPYGPVSGLYEVTLVQPSSGQMAPLAHGAEALVWWGESERDVAYYSGGTVYLVRPRIPEGDPIASIPTAIDRIHRQRLTRWTLLAGIAAAIASVALMAAWPRVKQWTSLLAAARRAASLGWEPGVLKRALLLLDELYGSVHALKNTATILPTPGAEGPDREAVSYCLEPQNLTALSRHSSRALELAVEIRELTAPLIGAERAATRLPTARLTGLVTDLLEMTRAVVARADDVLRTGGRWEEYEVSGSPPPDELVAMAESQLHGLHGLLAGDDGLLSRLRAVLVRYDVGNIARAVAYEMDAAARGRGAEIRLEHAGARTARVCADPDLVIDILSSIVRNAVEAFGDDEGAHPSGERIITILTSAEDGMARFTVRDTGPGIPVHLLHQLQSGAVVSTKGRGRGTGLANARDILRAIPGGSLSIHSPGAGLGTEVTIEMEMV